MKRRNNKETHLPFHNLAGTAESSNQRDNKIFAKSTNVSPCERASGWLLLILFAVLAWTYVSAQSRHSSIRLYRARSVLTTLKNNNWPWPLIHIVHTRFMQEQGNLTALGLARLALFQTFGLPTMAAQSSQQFLWIIKTDPQLDPDIRQTLIEIIAPYPNFYLVASNTNFRINEQFPGAWRDGAEGLDLTRSDIYTGNQTLLETALALEAQYPVLETRLDADDGLNKYFIEYVQKDAINAFQQKEPHLRWKYWCAGRHLEWHWTLVDKEQDAGVLLPRTSNQMCITPGITVGFPIHSKADQVPIFAHHVMAEEIRNMDTADACGYEDSSDCLTFIEIHAFEAVRSRTPTSAGMLDILIGKEVTLKAADYAYLLWDKLHRDFDIKRDTVRFINRYITTHLLEIAQDNLVGQCTTGHSCKDMAKAALNKLISKASNISLPVVSPGVE